MPKLVSELLNEVAQSDDKVAAITAAAKDNAAIVDILKVCYDPEWEFNLAPSYPEKFKLDQTTPAGLSITELVKERRKLQIFRKTGPYATLDQERREIIFLNFIECLHFSEAEVLVFAKDHALVELHPWLDKTLYNTLFNINVPVESPEQPQPKSEEVVAVVVDEVKPEVSVEEESKDEDSKVVAVPKRRGRPKKSDSK